jgi:tripartite motif-containing protein 71
VTAPELGAWEAVWMGVEETEAEDGWYPAEWDVTFNELSIFEKKVTFGRIDKDSDDIVSSYVMSDWSGGGQIDLLTGADQSRYRHGVLDARTPGAITLPQYVETITPTGAAGDTTYPMGQIGNYPVHIKDDLVYTWDEDTDTLSTGVAIAHDPVGKPTRFNAGLHVPLGTSGYAIVTLSGSDPVWNRYAGVSEGADSSATSSPNAVDFEVWDNKIWALTPTGVLAYSFTGANGAWFWDQSWDEARAAFLKLDTSQTPKRLLTYVDNNGDPCLVIVSDQAVFRVDFVSKEYAKTAIQFPPHPDFGRGATVWRPGEDLKVAVGLEMISYSAAGVVDPETGLSRNDGMPFTNLGTICDLEAETSSLYAAVSGSSSSSVSYTYSDKVGAAGTGNGQFADIRGLAADSTGDVWAADENNERVQRFDSLLTYETNATPSSPAFVADNGPFDVAVDGSDNLYVVDRGNNSIHKRTGAGTWSELIDGGGAGSSSWVLQTTVTPHASVNGPQQICVSPVDGKIFVMSNAGGVSNLIALDTAGAYIDHEAVQLGYGVTVDSSGSIYVIGFDDVYKYELTGGTTLTLLDEEDVDTHATAAGITTTNTKHIATDNTYLYYTTAEHYVVKILASTLAYVAHWGGSGSGNGQFATPWGIYTNGTHVWVVDSGNNRVQQFTVAGAYVAQFTVDPGSRAITPDTSGDLFVTSVTNDVVDRYTTAGVFIDSFAQTEPTGVAVISGDIVWVANQTGDSLAKWDEVVTGGGTGNGEFTSPESLDVKRSSGRIYVADSGNTRVQYFTSAGAYEGQWGSAGSGDGEFGASGPTALAINQTSGDVYVVDPSNYRVQQFSATGSFVREWGQSGTDDGEFQSPTCLDVHPTTFSVFVGDSGRDDVQEFSASGSFLRRFGSNGSGDGEFTSVSGLAIAQDGALIYVADDSLERIQAFDASSASAVFLALPSIHYWTGTGWHGAWEHSDSSEQLTWMSLTATDHDDDGYRLWWGCTDGNLYTMPLRRTFHNPRSGWQAGYDRFASSGYLISSRFDALMAGFDKKASRLVVFMDNASPTERVRVQYRIDSEEMAWTNFTDAAGDTVYVDTIGRTVLPFGVDADGFSWGEQFNWIQFKFSFERGSSAYQTPVMSAAVLNYTKVPQQARTFMFTVPFPKESWNGRTGIEIRDGLADLLRAGQYVKLVHQDTTYRGQLAAIAGLTSLGPNTTGGATINFIEIGVDN